MPLNSMELYSCSACGNILSGIEWEEHTKGEKDYKCPICQIELNEDELYSED